MRLDVIVRGVIANGAAGAGRIASGPGAGQPCLVQGASPQTVILYCLNSLLLSLVKAMQDGVVTEVRLHMLELGHPPGLVATIERLLARCPFPARLVRATADGGGREASDMASCAYQHAFSLLASDQAGPQEGLLYFVEADCLHGHDSISELVREHVELSASRGGDIVTCPVDDPGLYRDPPESIILARRSRYWRTIPRATRTLLMYRHVLLRFREAFAHDGARLAAPGGSSFDPLEHLFRIIPCVAPMPSLAVSILRGDEAPFSPWRSWWRYSEPVLSENGGVFS